MDASNKKGIIILLAASVITALIYNHFSPYGITLVGNWSSAGSTPTQETNDGQKQIEGHSIEIIRIDLVEKIINDRSRILIDVRQENFYSQGHLPGALNFPLIRFEENFQKMIATLSKDTPLLVYCSSVECTDSHKFADILINMMFTDVKIFSPGYRGWVDAGRKVEKNES
jgi:rhodanese-related sulfurtransferase